MSRRSRPAQLLSGAVAGLFVLLLCVLPGPTVFGPAAPAPPAHGAAAPLLPHALIPRHPQHTPTLSSTKLTVDPYHFYTTEPAPMGIADFGIGPTGNGLTYTTTAFYGETTIQNLTVNAGGSAALTVQLNIVLEFTAGGSPYQFWIQDVAWIDTSSNTITFENNIWNFSAGNGSMDSNSVTGNGSVQGGAFYYVFSTGPGTGVTMTYPATFGLLAVATTVNGLPEVLFEYRDGFGFQTYDNAVFPFAKAATGIDFIVDGTQLNPFGLYDDAELILGGPGGGSQTAATSANLSVSLAYYNGRNFQSVQNAFNFGSDTAEGISGVLPHRSAILGNGTLTDFLTFGNGSPGALYDRHYSALVQVTTPFPNGTLVVGGTARTPFQGSPINITIAPGTYTFDIYNATGRVATANGTVSAGGFLALTIPPGFVNTVDFVETGLPNGHSWTVSLGATSLSSKSTTIRFTMINGSYSFQVQPIGGYRANLTHGNLLVAGPGAAVSLIWSQVVYTVQLFETGLPSNTTWSISVNNRTYSTSGVFLTFALPNGSMGYTLGIVPGWSAAPNTHGKFQINANPISKTVTFRQFTYGVLAVANGLPSNTAWGFQVDQNWTYGSISKLLAQAPNGTFPYHVLAASGWIASPPNGTVVVNARPLSLNISFVQFLYPVTFTEIGLAPGTPWGIQLGSIHFGSPNGSFTASLGNASYSYRIDTVPGYSVVGAVDRGFSVAGAPPSAIQIEFALLPPVLGYLIGSVTPAGALLWINGSLTNYSGTSFNISLAPGRHSIEITLSGYRPFFENVSISPGARTILRPVVLTPLPDTGHQAPPATGNSDAGTVFGLPPLLVGLALVALVAVVGAVLALRYRRR